MRVNYRLIVLRQFRKYPLYSFINVAGLSTGILVSFLIFLYVQYEYSYDQSHKKKNEIYRVVHTRNTGNSITHSATTPLSLAPVIHQEINGVIRSVRMLRDSYGLIEFGDNTFNETAFAFVDSAIVNVFDFNWIYGNPSTVFLRPDGLAISESTSIKYFGNENPLGKILKYKNWGQEFTYQVSGVYEDIPANSHFQFDIMAPFESNNNLWYVMHGRDWYFSGGWTYVEIPKHTPGFVEQQFSDLIARHLPEDLKAGTSFQLQPLTTIHLESSLSSEIEANGNLQYVYLLGSIGILILLIASSNFAGLSAVRSLLRMKEMGVRKSLGGSDGELKRQFFYEAGAYTFISMALAIALLPIVLPFFSSLSGRELQLDQVLNISTGFAFTLIFALTTLLTGFYPSFFISNFKIAALFKGNHSSLSKGTVRKMLVGVQFVALIILLVGTWVIEEQLAFMSTKNLGFDADEVAYLNGFDIQSLEKLRNEISTIPGVHKTSVASGIPGSLNAQMELSLCRLEGMEEHERVEVFRSVVDENYFDLLSMKLEMGKNFQPQTGDSAAPIIVNRALIQNTIWKDDPIGHKIEVFNMLGRSMGERRIIGTVNDFHVESLHSVIKPAVFMYSPANYNLMMQFDGSRARQVRAEALDILKKYRANMGGDFYFLNQDLGRQYEAEERLGSLAKMFTSIALVISIVGVFGLTSFSAEQRLKEMSIRQILGANGKDIFIAFSKSFVKVTAAGIIIGIPLAYWLALDWLSDFAYRINVHVDVFAYSVLLLIALVCGVTGYHSFRVLKVNPSTVLKNE